MFSVEVNNLAKRFGKKTVLENITFSHSGGVLGIEGPNGSGKSTLLKCLAGLLKPDNGDIDWQSSGNRLSHKELKHHLGYVAPYINLYHELSVRENLDLILTLKRETDNRPEGTIEQEFDIFQLSGISDQAFGELSTGQQQRARLACTMICNPSILILDEPGANLDIKGKSAISSVLDDFREKNKLVILASNNPEELDLADDIYSVG